MGGGHVSRPDFGMPQPDPAYPLTEFYLLLQHALDKAGRFALPALYARVQAPARPIYLDAAREYLSLSPTGREGDLRLLAGWGWRARLLQPVDLFPHTEHVECVAVLAKIRGGGM